MGYNAFVTQEAVMQKIRTEYLTNPEFDPQVVAKASSAAEGLCKWIKGMEVYHRVSKVWFWSLPLSAMESSFAPCIHSKHCS